jgi:drug/metabolite transporter (DMT)-like permease
MAGILLSLASALFWGTGDFMGGVLTRRLAALQVVAWSQVAGGLLITLIAIASGAPLTLASFGWGMVAGLCGLVGLIALYRGLALGPMALISPISACGAVVPLSVAFLSGHLPQVTALIGIALAFAGIILASLTSGKDADDPQKARIARIIQPGIMFAIIAALGFGFFFIFLARGATGDHFATFWAVVGARIASLTILFSSMIFRGTLSRAPLNHIWIILGVGVGDTAANTLYALSTTYGNLGIVSVIGSLYPVTTVVLAFVVLRERLTIQQIIGVILALAGVALMALG